ncbi:MAG: SoxR reducing system RseC family protein [Cocleimonas sp.]|nr:SoxR reducing system RseC family protein [Cocleimonas sp.]
MIEETGVVERVEGSYMWVSPASSGGACGSCQSSTNCSTSLLATLLQGNKTKTIRVDNKINAKANDTVILGIHPQALLSGSALLYLLPIFCLFVFAIIGQQFFNEIGSIGFGLAGLLLGLLLSKKIAKSVLMKSRLALVGLKIQA